MSGAIAEANRVVAAFAEAWNRHDMAAFAELFAHDAEFVNVVGMWWRGKSEIRAAHEFTHATMFKASRLKMLEVSVRLPAPELALARSRWLLEGHVAPDGSALPARKGILALLVELDTGKGLIVDAQNTDIIEDVLTRPQ
jgi:uncharacterized protein (TIGR02246 family)